MKCRRSKTSRGARLRGSAANPGVEERPLSPRPLPPAPTDRGTAPAGATVALMRVDGPAKGAIDYAGTVIIGRHGQVSGDITATIIVVEGQVEGDLQAAQALRLMASARVVGNSCAPRIAVARGASVRGRVTTQRRPGLAAASELDDSDVADLLAGA